MLRRHHLRNRPGSSNLLPHGFPFSLPPPPSPAPSQDLRGRSAQHRRASAQAEELALLLTPPRDDPSQVSPPPPPSLCHWRSAQRENFCRRRMLARGHKQPPLCPRAPRHPRALSASPPGGAAGDADPPDPRALLAHHFVLGAEEMPWRNVLPRSRPMEALPCERDAPVFLVLP